MESLESDIQMLACLAYSQKYIFIRKKKNIFNEIIHKCVYYWRGLNLALITNSLKLVPLPVGSCVWSGWLSLSSGESS